MRDLIKLLRICQEISSDVDGERVLPSHVKRGLEANGAVAIDSDLIEDLIEEVKAIDKEARDGLVEAIKRGTSGSSGTKPEVKPATVAAEDVRHDIQETVLYRLQRYLSEFVNNDQWTVSERTENGLIDALEDLIGHIASGITSAMLKARETEIDDTMHSIYHCAGCYRPEAECSENPCPPVIEDRRS